MLLSSSPFTSAMRRLLCSSILSFVLIFGASNASQQPPSTQQQPCIHDHFSALLHLKQGFDSGTRNTTLSAWNASNEDCCSWPGVTCDASTGHVVGLNLSYLDISGRADWRSLLRLRSLQQLNLSGNSFDPCPFPSGLDQLANLTHLGLSSLFYGQIPLDISHLKNLISLHLSYSASSYSESMRPQLSRSTFLALVQNLSRLEELQLEAIAVGSFQGREWGEALSAIPNLRKLRMFDCNLSGPIHPSLSRLRFLSELDLGFNSLFSRVPPFIANFSSLTTLGLRSCHLHGVFPASIFNLPNLSHVEIGDNENLTVFFPNQFQPNFSLRYLSVSGTGFHGEIPYSFSNLKELVFLDAEACKLSGSLPPFLFNHTSLRYLYLARNYLSGPLPSLYNNVLANVDLSDNAFSGEIPSSLFTLEFLGLSNNNLSGPLPSSFNNENWRLTFVDLSYNLLNGAIPSLFFSLPSVTKLYLESNQFSSVAGGFENVSFSPLQVLHLRNNSLQGPIPGVIFQLKNLQGLDLSMNNFSGAVDLSLFSQLKQLVSLSLSDNSWSVHDSSSNSTLTPFPQIIDWGLRSCSITRVPNVLRQVRSIELLDLSYNEIIGEIPPWIWKLGKETYSSLNLSHNELESFAQPFPNISLSSWRFLDLSFNKLEGSVIVPSQSTNLYSLANNFFSGKVPSIICNFTSLSVLDLSHNLLSGSIPPCLGEKSNSLYVLKLQGNVFDGTLNLKFKEGCYLRTLDVSRNQLEGKVPTSVANCSLLELLNLGDNQMQDIFPSWLGNLPSLRVLILRSNKFYGAIGLNADDETYFPQLQIFDISSNGFTGSLPMNIFKSWKRMIGDNESLSILSGLLGASDNGIIYYQDTASVVIKGTEQNMEKILTAFTLIDVSDNKFHGSIPNSVGDLRSLILLNMSYNNFTGQIPASLQNLRFLETLDLSQNSLAGEIPPQLTKLNFLGVLNLSHNQLVGPIPQGQQFSAFSNDSFLSNMDLCGPPLTKKCGTANILPPMTKQSQGIGKFDWGFIWSGFAVGNGVAVGLFFWTLALWTKGRRQFILLIDKVVLFIFPSGVFSPSRHR